MSGISSRMDAIAATQALQNSLATSGVAG